MTVSIKTTVLVALAAGVVATAVLFVFAEDIGKEELEGYGQYPEQERNVTCYKWVENGTAMVTCPDRVYAPNSWVNITVKPCSEYEFASDEPHPCGDYS